MTLHFTPLTLNSMNCLVQTVESSGNIEVAVLRRDQPLEFLKESQVGLLNPALARVGVVHTRPSTPLCSKQPHSQQNPRVLRQVEELVKAIEAEKAAEAEKTGKKPSTSS